MKSPAGGAGEPLSGFPAGRRGPRQSADGTENAAAGGFDGRPELHRFADFPEPDLTAEQMLEAQ